MTSFGTAILLVVAVAACDSNPTPHPITGRADSSVSTGGRDVVGTELGQGPGDYMDPDRDDEGAAPEASVDANDGQFDEADGCAAGVSDGDDGDDNGTSASPDVDYDGEIPTVRGRRRP